jgi:hypothetical protein
MKAKSATLEVTKTQIGRLLCIEKIITLASSRFCLASGFSPSLQKGLNTEDVFFQFLTIKASEIGTSQGKNKYELQLLNF